MRKKVALTPTATLSLAREAPPTRHPTVSTGKLPPSIPSSLPSHVLFPCCRPLLRPPTAQATCPKESWQNYSEANKDTNGRPRQLALASAFITAHFLRHTKASRGEPPLRAHDGLRRAVTPAFRAHGFRG